MKIEKKINSDELKKEFKKLKQKYLQENKKKNKPQPEPQISELKSLTMEENKFHFFLLVKMGIYNKR